jgi:hypothetical protein
MKKINDTQTNVVYYTLSDMKLSQVLSNQLLKDLAKSIKLLKDILEKMK